jgi:CubicO group peptidase (beta-lactamase class C family)
VPLSVVHIFHFRLIEILQHRGVQARLEIAAGYGDTKDEPGRNFTYSSADTVLLAHVFQKETGQDIETYA